MALFRGEWIGWGTTDACNEYEQHRCEYHLSQENSTTVLHVKKELILIHM